MIPLRPLPHRACIVPRPPVAICMGSLKRVLAIALSIASACAVSAIPCQGEEDRVLALVGGRILTMSDAGELPNGTVVIRNEKIEAVGTDIAIPEGAQVIELNGLVVTPGLIDLRSPLWMSADTLADSGSTGVLDAADSIDPYDRSWLEVAQQGVTATYTQPNSSGVLGGYGVLSRVHEGNGEADSIIVKREAGFQSSLGVGTYGQSSRGKIAEFDGLKKRLTDTKEYVEQWKKYRDYEAEEAKKKAAGADAKPAADAPAARSPSGSGEANPGEGQGRGFRRGPRGGGPPGEGPRPERPPGETPPDPKPVETKGTEAKPTDAKPAEGAASGDKAANPEKKEEPPKKPKFDTVKERLAKVLSGELPIHLEAHRGDDVNRALELAKEFSLTLVLEGLSNLGSGTQTVQQANLPIVLGPWLDGEQSDYHAHDRTKQWGTAFADYQGQLAIATFGRSARSSTDLRAHAAAAVAAGFSPLRVLQAITSVPANLAGEGSRLGKIQPGFDADLAVFAGEPLDLAAQVRMTIVAGKIVTESTTAAALAAASPIVVWETLPSSLPSTYAVRSNNVLQGDGTWQPNLLHIADGKLIDILPYESILTDVTLFDAQDCYLTPGLVTAYAELAPTSWNDRQEISDSGSVRAADVYDPLSPVVNELVAGGVLRAGHAPGSTRVLAGQMSEMRLGAENSVVQPELAELVVLSSASRNRERFPASLAGQIQMVSNTLSGTWDASPLYLPKSALAVLEKAQQDRRDSMLAGKRKTILLAQSDAELAAAIKLARQWKLSAALLAPSQLESIIPVLAAEKIGVLARSVRPSDYQWYVRDLVAASAAGISIGFTGTDPMLLRQTAADTVRAGMPPATALLSLTSAAADVVGMSQSAGRLLPGSDADFVIWNGSPLNLAARPLAIIVDGDLVDTDN